MMYLLNWRIWAAVFFAIAQAAFGWKAYVMGEKSTQKALDDLRFEYTSQALAAEQSARAKEQSLQVANRKVSANYESLKTATATAVGALDADRMRLQDALAARSVPGDPGASPGADASPEVRILGECIDRRTEVAKDAQAVTDKLIGLQDYVRRVVKP